jgi:hypothetical protein
MIWRTSSEGSVVSAGDGFPSAMAFIFFISGSRAGNCSSAILADRVGGRAVRINLICRAVQKISWRGLSVRQNFPWGAQCREKSMNLPPELPASVP